MDPATHARVRLRAKRLCEYCRYPESESILPFTLDHIIARKHRGSDGLDNLAFACGFCNQHKGTDLTGVDPSDGAIVRLFNPRADRWADHFRWEGVRIVALTPIGRVTEYVLSLNDDLQLARRQALLESGWSFEAGV